MSEDTSVAPRQMDKKGRYYLGENKGPIMESTIEYASDAERREAIVVIAHAEFAAEGFAAANVSTIARLSRVSTATLYRLFGSKEELFISVMARDMNAAQSWIESQKPTDDPMADLKRFAIAFATLNTNPTVRGMARAYLASLRRDNKYVHLTNARELALTYLTSVAERCLAQGQLAGGLAEEIAYFAHAVLVGDTLQLGLWGGDETKSPLTSVQHAERMLSWLHRVFGPNRA